MADYKEIKGNRVQYLSTDPTLDANSEGQVWYNSVLGSLKGLVQLKAWSAGSNLSTARRGSGAMGTSTAAAIAGGQAAPAYVNSTEEYSGYAWTAGGNLNTTRAFLNNGTVGTQTSGLTFGGEQPGGGDLGSTEEYNGSAWTSNPTGLNTVRRDLGGVGIQTAALAFGGTSTPTAVTESYDGSTWTSLPATLNTGRAGLVGVGTQTAALAIGGPSTVVESWNGSTWTNGPSLNFQLDGSAAASGTQTNALTFGGRKPPGTTLVDSSEQYDGNTWVTTASMATARRELMGMGTAQNGLAAGGYTPPTFSAATEEYFSDIANYSASSQDAWASGGNLNTGRTGNAGFGTQTAAVSAGGFNSYPAVEEYNGSSWTSVTSLPLGVDSAGSCGTLTQGLIFGGQTVPGPNTNNTLQYDGTSWSPVGTLNTTRRDLIGAGTQTSALAALGAVDPPFSTATEEYDGTSWTSVNNANTDRRSAGGGGSQTSALAFGGFGPPGTPPAAYKNSTESYDGTTWTNVANLNTARGILGGGGTSNTDALAFGGYNGSVYLGSTEKWDGTSWTTAPSLATARGTKFGLPSSSTSAQLFAGGSPGSLTATEEFTGGAPASPTGAAASILTTS